MITEKLDEIDQLTLLFLNSSQVSWEQPNLVNVENLGGRLMTSLTLHRRDRPYLIKSDLTIMPHVTLTIAPGTVLEFAPRVGILVLGTLVAKGRRHEEIVMRPLANDIPAGIEVVPNMYKRSVMKDSYHNFTTQIRST